MKRLFVIVLGASLSFSLSAQTVWDQAEYSWSQALMLSENHYSGTARSIGMGNALTAVGGDLGAVTLNPAASPVTSYSQVTLTPGITLSVGNASGNYDWNVSSVTGAPRGFADDVTTRFTRFKVPNVGFVVNMNTGLKHGWKRTSFGFVLNTTNDFTGRFNASGENSLTSYAAAVASSAGGCTPEELGGNNWFSSSAPYWEDKVAYLSRIINASSYLPANQYAGISQAIVQGPDGKYVPQLPYAVNQTYGRQTTGGKYDMVINLAADYEDKFYVGANVGITLLNYGYAEYWQESPADQDFFPPVTFEDGTQGRWNSLRMKRNLKLRGSGVYLKAGMLWRPISGLRLGAAIQTPTILTVTMRDAYQGQVNMSGKNFQPYTSPEDEWEYTMVHPFRFNTGVAYSFGKFAVLSADYEWVDYSSIRYDNPEEDFGAALPGRMADANVDIQEALGVSHLFRLGFEFKPSDALALRVGYNYTSSPLKNYLEYVSDTEVNLYPLDESERRALSRSSVSFGAGYTFGSLFVDAAFRIHYLPCDNLPADNIVTPYYYYATDDYTPKYIDEVPSLQYSMKRFDASLTLGWRF